MDQYGDEMLRFAYWQLHDRHLAEDAAQETFLRAFRSLDSFRGDSSAKTWLFRIARNTCVDMRRRGRRTILTPTPPLPPDHRTPDTIAEEREAEAQLKRALDTLDAESRTLIALYFFENWSAPEIAELLHIPIGTVRTRIRRAKERLASKLGGMTDV